MHHAAPFLTKKNMMERMGGSDEGGVVSPSWLTNKQRLAESRDAEKQLDNGADCAAAVKWSGNLRGPGWEVSSRETEGQKEE